jgi:hypothetical protein
MTRTMPAVLAISLIAALSSDAFAAPPNRPAPPPRQAAPPPRQAAPAPPRPAAPPPARPSPPPTQGFNFNHDINARPAPVAQPRPAVTQQRPPVTQQRPPVTQQRPPVTNNAVRPAPNFRRAPFTNTSARGPYQGRAHGAVVQNPRHWSGNWQWNRGLAWEPAPTYWGGGFWGPFALGALAVAALYGYIVDPQSQVYYPSYQVEPDSPGAQLLQNYGLQQTPCGADNLVVIWGPDNSVICAFPNDTVGPGNYDLDPTTLSLVSESP